MAKNTNRNWPVSPYWVFAGLCLGLCLITYHGYTDNHIYNDDSLWMSKARYQMTLGNLFAFRVIGFFRPMINASFFIMERIAPGNLGFYYYTNIFLHFINTIIVFHLLARLGWERLVAATAAILFAVTSTHSAAVGWISARTGLFMFFFLLLAILVLLHHPRGWKSVVASCALYGLALLSKETAVIGLPLLVVVHLHMRAQGRPAIATGALVAYGAMTAGYMILRAYALGGYVQSNWEPGVHMIANLGGGFLFQLYPWSLSAYSGRDPQWTASPGGFFLETMALPLLALLLVVAWKRGQLAQMMFATGWMIVAMVPVSMFKFRFFTMGSITHNRYYYLSSVGACLVAAILLGMLWRSTGKKRVLRTGVVALFVLMIGGEINRVWMMEKKMAIATNRMESAVNAIVDQMDKTSGLSVCALENPMFSYHYLKSGVELKRPGWKIVETEGGPEGAAQMRPCLFIYFYTDATGYRMGARVLE